MKGFEKNVLKNCRVKKRKKKHSKEREKKSQLNFFFRFGDFFFTLSLARKKQRLFSKKQNQPSCAFPRSSSPFFWPSRGPRRVRCLFFCSCLLFLFFTRKQIQGNASATDGREGRRLFFLPLTHQISLLLPPFVLYKTKQQRKTSLSPSEVSFLFLIEREKSARERKKRKVKEKKKAEEKEKKNGRPALLWDFSLKRKKNENPPFSSLLKNQNDNSPRRTRWRCPE